MDYEIIIRFLLAALWGGIVGLEREYRGKSAGFRTMIMISIGSCFFTIISMKIGAAIGGDRIASNIVTGIGFLGAGVIFRSDNRVNGITTAATIWAVAAVGMGIGAGFYFASACSSLLILIVLVALPYIEIYIDKINQSRTYSVKCLFSEDAVAHFELLLRKNRLRFKLTRQVKKGEELSVSWEVDGTAANHKQFIREIMKEPGLQDFGY
jgi:putative Mg2+ transporter-C (MgtC) family protein